MGFASGLPLLLTGDTLSYRLAKAGFGTAAIGAFALVGLPYALKVVWAPLLDRVPAPLVGRLGRRRGWLIATQVALAATLVALGAVDPHGALGVMASLALVVAFLSASQDVVVDAYRIERLALAEQGAGAAVTQLGYRIAMLVAGAGALALSDHASWRTVYGAMALLMGFAAGISAVAAEPVRSPRGRSVADGAWHAGWRELVVEPVRDLTRRPGWMAVLSFALLYKLGDAVTVQMGSPFFVALGFDGAELATARKLPGLAATALGALGGGVLVARRGMFVALLVGGVLQAATNLLFAALALRGHDTAFLVAAVVGDGFTGGIGSAAFVAYLSALCSIEHTAGQYALLTSLMAVGRTLFAASGGWMAAHMEWAPFWIASTVLAVPGLLGLLRLRSLARTQGRGAPLAGIEPRGERERAATDVSPAG